MLHVCILHANYWPQHHRIFGPKQYRMRLKNSFWKKIQIEKRDWWEHAAVLQTSKLKLNIQHRIVLIIHKKHKNRPTREHRIPALQLTLTFALLHLRSFVLLSCYLFWGLSEHGLIAGGLQHPLWHTHSLRREPHWPGTVHLHVHGRLAHGAAYLITCSRKNWWKISAREDAQPVSNYVRLKILFHLTKPPLLSTFAPSFMTNMFKGQLYSACARLNFLHCLYRFHRHNLPVHIENINTSAENLEKAENVQRRLKTTSSATILWKFQPAANMSSSFRKTCWKQFGAMINLILIWQLNETRFPLQKRWLELIWLNRARAEGGNASYRTLFLAAVSALLSSIPYKA